jgi:hypothetical protein
MGLRKSNRGLEKGHMRATFLSHRKLIGNPFRRNVRHPLSGGTVRCLFSLVVIRLTVREATYRIAVYFFGPVSTMMACNIFLTYKY